MTRSSESRALCAGLLLLDTATAAVSISELRAKNLAFLEGKKQSTAFKVISMPYQR